MYMYMEMIINRMACFTAFINGRSSTEISPAVNIDPVRGHVELSET
jgi:hypothetical protein